MYKLYQENCIYFLEKNYKLFRSRQSTLCQHIFVSFLPQIMIQIYEA